MTGAPEATDGAVATEAEQDLPDESSLRVPRRLGVHAQAGKYR